MDEESGLLPSKVVLIGGHSAKVGHAAYQVLPLHTEYQINGPEDLQYCRPHSDGHKFYKGLFTTLTIPISWLWILGKTYLIPSGHIGVSINNGVPEFLPPGWHYLGSAFRSMISVVPINTDTPIINLTKGIVTVSDGWVGIARDKGRFILLGPGMHQWDSATFEWHGFKELTNDALLKLGPYTLVTVPPGEVAITENNGALVILSENHETLKRSHFLDHSKWVHKGMLSTQIQIDNLPSSNLLSADRVEINLDSTVAWHIVDPVKVGETGGHTMAQLRETVHRAARACLSNMIAHREISGQAIAQSVDKAVAVGHAYQPGQPAQLFGNNNDQTQTASQQQLSDCNAGLQKIGVEVTQLAIVKMTIHHDDIRAKIASVAAIPAEAHKARTMAQAQADSAIMQAQGEATARRLKAEAEADAIRAVASAQEEAGQKLGDANSTAAKLAQIAATGEALKNAKATVYFTQAGQTPTMLLNQ